MAHPPLQDPGARVTLLFNKTGLLPNCRHKAVSRYTPQSQPTAPQGHFLETQTCCWLGSRVTLSPGLR